MATVGRTMNASASAAAVAAPQEKRWDLAFVGLLFYLVVEYTRLSAMYPVLQPLHVGKIAVAVCILGLLVAPQTRMTWTPAARAVDILMILFMAFAFVSTVFAVYPDRAMNGFLDALRWLVIYFIITRVLTSRWRVRVFLLMVLILNLKLAQFVVRNYLSHLAAGVDPAVLAKFGVGAGSTGFFANASDFGVGMCVVFPLAAYLFFAKDTKLVKLVLLASTILFLSAILFCGSRGAVVGALAVGAVAVLRNPSKTAALLLIFLLIPGIIYFLPDASKDRMESGMNWQDDGTASHRIYLWKQGLKMFGDYPLFGVGPQNYSIVRFERYNENDPKPSPYVAHSTYIEALTEVGLLGSLIVLVLWITFFRLNALTRKHVLATDPLGRKSFLYCLACGLDLGMVGFMVSGAFVSVLFYPHIWILLGISVSMHLVAMQTKELPAAARVAAGPRKVPRFGTAT